MVIYHTVPSIFDSGHRPAAAWPAEEGEEAGMGLWGADSGVGMQWGCPGQRGGAEMGLERCGLLLHPCKPASGGLKL